MKKILFVNPPILNTELYGELGEAGSAAYPLGLCSLAAVVRKHNFDVQILDASALRMNLNETASYILKLNPDYLGLTAVTITIDRVAELAKAIKNRNKNIIIILGGPHITAVPDETFARYPWFDVAVIGEGEITIIELLEKMEDKADLSSVCGLLLRDNGTIKKTETRPPIDNLDELPYPAWDLLPDLPKYYHPTVYSFNRLPSTHLVTSRGCPGRCIFCDTAVFGRKYRFFSSDYVMQMIRILYNTYGVRDILFDDDLFIGNKKRLYEICNMLIANNLDLSWSCNARIDLMDEDMLKIMRKSGCWQIAYGIESGSQKILDYIKKNTNLKQIEELLKWTNRAGIRTKGFFMMGYPIETREDIFQTIEFAKRIDLYDFQINFFTPLPGSEAYKILTEMGVQARDWSELNLHTEPTFIPRGLSKEELIGLNKLAFRKFYLRLKIIISYLKMIRNWENLLKLSKGAFALSKFWLKLKVSYDIRKEDKIGSINTNYKKYESRNFFVRLMIKRFVRELLKLIKLDDSGLVLDLGCGEGYVMNMLKKNNKNLKFVGVDIDLNSLYLAKQRNYDSLFVQADIANLPFKESAFATLICLETLEHIISKPEEAIKEIKRIAKNKIILSVPNEPFFSLANLAMGKRIRYFGSDPEHRYFWNKNSFLNLLNKFFNILDFKSPFPWIIALAEKRQ